MNKRNARSGIGLAAITLLIVAGFAMVTPAEAYTIGPKPSNGGAPCSGHGNAVKVMQICGYTWTDAYQMTMFPQFAANAVYSIAQQNGLSIQRSRSSIETEIRGHAAIRTAPNVLIPRGGTWRWSWEVADPMDIETNYVEDWVAFLD